MKNKVLSLKVSEEEMEMIVENYREFLMRVRIPWSRHRWMKSLILDRPPLMFKALPSDKY